MLVNMCTSGNNGWVLPNEERNTLAISQKAVIASHYSNFLSDISAAVEYSQKSGRICAFYFKRSSKLSFSVQTLDARM